MRVGRFARATIVLEHAGTTEYGEIVSLVAGDGAQVTLVTVQEWDDDAHHLAQHDLVIGRDAAVRHIAVTIGGGIVRFNTNASYTGPGGSFEGLGVYFADAGQHLEHRLFVDHGAPHCRSNVEYKGALQGDTAHTVWVGDVLIRASAEGTDTYELNRNLVLTEGARADSVPNLEIETGEIKGAGHASATGRFDDQQLFYLMARGIPEDEARRLVVRGFFASVVGRIGVPEVQERLMAAIERELAGRCRMSEQVTDTDFVRVCRLDELPAVGAALAEIEGRRVTIVHTADGDVHCVDDTCTHANVSLSEGELDGCTLECWLHGSRFDLRTGEPTGPPAIVPIAVHTVRIEGDDVYVALSEES